MMVINIVLMTMYLFVGYFWAWIVAISFKKFAMHNINEIEREFNVFGREIFESTDDETEGETDNELNDDESRTTDTDSDSDNEIEDYNNNE